VQQILGDFGKTIGLDDLELDAAGYCCLMIDNNLVINIEFEEPDARLLLYAKVGRPGPDRAAALTAILEANYLGRGTGGATLGLEPESGSIVLSRDLAIAGMDVPGFSDALERFVNTAEVWSKRLGEASASAPPSDPHDHPPVGGIRG
jgi:hypothetical protein